MFFQITMMFGKFYRGVHAYDLYSIRSRKIETKNDDPSIELENALRELFHNELERIGFAWPNANLKPISHSITKL